MNFVNYDSNDLIKFYIKNGFEFVMLEVILEQISNHL